MGGINVDQFTIVRACMNNLMLHKRRGSSSMMRFTSSVHMYTYVHAALDTQLALSSQ